MTSGDQLVLNVGTVAHEGQHAGAEYLKTVVSAVPLPHTRCAFLPGANDAFVHGDVVVQARHNLTGVQGQ